MKKLFPLCFAVLLLLCACSPAGDSTEAEQPAPDTYDGATILVTGTELRVDPITFYEEDGRDCAELPLLLIFETLGCEIERLSNWEVTVTYKHRVYYLNLDTVNFYSQWKKEINLLELRYRSGVRKVIQKEVELKDATYTVMEDLLVDDKTLEFLLLELEIYVSVEVDPAGNQVRIQDLEWYEISFLRNPWLHGLTLVPQEEPVSGTCTLCKKPYDLLDPQVFYEPEKKIWICNTCFMDHNKLFGWTAENQRILALMQNHVERGDSVELLCDAPVELGEGFYDTSRGKPYWIARVYRVPFSNEGFGYHTECGWTKGFYLIDPETEEVTVLTFPLDQEETALSFAEDFHSQFTKKENVTYTLQDVSIEDGMIVYRVRVITYSDKPTGRDSNGKPVYKVLSESYYEVLGDRTVRMQL